MYDLISRQEEPLDVFKLGSYNEGTPEHAYLNHANDCMFSNIHMKENPIPLLYVTSGTGTGMDADGYYYRCAVENITAYVDEEGKERYHAETVQTICYKPSEETESTWLSPCWGCPAWLVDSDASCLFIFSAIYRTKRECLPEDGVNTYIVTKFALPNPEQGGLIRLGQKDIIDQFSFESKIRFTQGGTIFDGKLYYTFGCPKNDYPDTIMVVSLEKKELEAVVEELDEAMSMEEIECCAVYQGHLFANTNGGFGMYDVMEV